MLPESFFRISGILQKSVGNFGRPFLLHFYVTIFLKKLKTILEIFFSKHLKILSHKSSEISDNFLHFEVIFGQFRAESVGSKFRAFLGKISRPILLKSPSEFLVNFRAKYEISANMATLLLTES